MEKIYFPRYLNRPLQVLWWEMDEVMIMIYGGVACNLIIDAWWTIFAGIPIWLVYYKAKKKYPRGFLKHLTYFVGLTKLKGYPPYSMKRFLE